MGIRKSGNQGLFITTGGNDLLHIMPTDPTTGIAASAIIRKILAYNNTGANVTLIFGTLNNLAVWVAMLPTLVAINGLDNVWLEEELPAVEFQVDTTPAAGSLGHIYVQASAALVLIQIEVEEIRESR